MQIKNVGVLGCGLMGSGIAQACASACHREESALGLEAYERFAKPDQ